MACFYVEILLNIEAAHVVVENHKDTKIVFNPFQVVIDDVIYNWKEWVFMPELIPSSITNVKYVNGEGVHVRLKTKTLPCSITVDDCDEIKGTTTIISCRFCKRQLLDRSFNRCLPLPSQEWSDISNDIFCHNHNCDGSQFNFIPKQNDLLFSEQEILLHRESLKMSNVIMNSSNIKCKRCFTVIGHTKTAETVNTVLLLHFLIIIIILHQRMKSLGVGKCLLLDNQYLLNWMESRGNFTDCVNEDIKTIALSPYKVCVQNIKGLPPSDFNLQHWVATKLLRLTKELQSFLFIVQSTQSNQQIVQIQCLGSVGLLITNHHHKSFVDFFSDTILTPAPKIKPKLILKVLFRSLLPTSSKLQPHLSTESILLPTEQCHQLYMHLMDNHLSIPPSLRNVQNLKVSYLEMEFKLPYKEI